MATVGKPSDNWIEAHLAAVAHDLRGPLSVVSGHAQVLRRLADGDAPPDRVRASAEAIMRSIERMAAVLDELSGAARAKGASRRVEPVAVVELLEEALKGARSRLVRIEAAPDLPPVAVDRHAFVHRTSVLLAGLRIGRGDQPITVRVERRDETVRISLPDAWIDLPLA